MLYFTALMPENLFPHLEIFPVAPNLPPLIFKKMYAFGIFAKKIQKSTERVSRKCLLEVYQFQLNSSKNYLSQESFGEKFPLNLLIRKS